MLDIAAAAQTDNSIEAAMEVLDFNSASYYQKAERFVMAVGFATHPRESLLTALYVSTHRLDDSFYYCLHE